MIFLTNNCNAVELFDWLLGVEDNVLLFSEELTPNAIKNRMPDMIVSYNYRHIIGKDVLSLMQDRAVNLHISLLPWNRGVAPNIFSFLESTLCGVTIHRIDAGVDTGDILLQKEIRFDYSIETLKGVYEKSHELIQSLFKENWDALKKCEIAPRKQDGSGSFHRSSDLAQYREIINYDETIEAFLKKADGVQYLQ